MKKILTKGILVLSMIFLLSTQIVGAKELTDIKSKYASDISVKSIKVSNMDVKLYPEFNETEKVLDSLIANYKLAFEFIQGKFGFEKITIENWKKYYSAIGDVQEYEKDASEEIINDIIEIGQFFDIFENSEKNNEIEKIYSQIKSKKGTDCVLVEKDVSSELELLLPYNSKLTSGDSCNNMVRVSVGIDVDKAVTYATTYATSPNKAKYKYFRTGDCTNFASQILEAAGVKQEVYSSETKGWWHTSTSHWYGTTHKHSISFIRADTFAKYMGVSYTTTNHKDFSDEVEKGDFIGFDKASDGDWDHIGFVTDNKTTLKTYGKKKYYDYKVAQHTSNYHEWVSDDDNGWETLEDNNYTYGIIRR